jgi:asparagine N-glycosylation enzyme membrane subunit Stt3
MTWNIIDTNGHGILDTHIAANIWSILNTKYKRTDIQSQTVLLDRLRMKKYKDGSSLTKHITDLDHHKTLANYAGANITDEAYKIIIIQLLPPSWNNVAMPLYDMPTAAEVITRLECYELHLSTQCEALLQNSNSTTAYMTLSSPHINGPPPT